MKRPFLVDTNVLIDLVNGVSGSQSLLSRTPRVFVSPVVHGEFLCGIRDNARSRAKKRVYDAFLSLPNVSRPPLTAETAERFARLWQFLTDAGRRIPSNDAWIAAHAMELGATLVTTDRHFDAIPNLDLLRAERTDRPPAS